MYLVLGVLRTLLIIRIRTPAGAPGKSRMVKIAGVPMLCCIPVVTYMYAAANLKYQIYTYLLTINDNATH